MTPYSVFIQSEVVNQVIQMPRSRRSKLLQFFEQLASNPVLKGEFREKDIHGREAEVKLSGTFLVTHYADHAVCELPILNLEEL